MAFASDITPAPKDAPMTKLSNLANDIGEWAKRSRDDPSASASANPFLSVRPMALAPPTAADIRVWSDPATVADILWDHAVGHGSLHVERYKSLMQHLTNPPLNKGTRDALATKITTDLQLGQSSSSVTATHIVHYVVGYLPRVVAGLRHEKVPDNVIRPLVLDPYVHLACASLRALSDEWNTKLSPLERTSRAIAFHMEVANGLDKDSGTRTLEASRALVDKYGAAPKHPAAAKTDPPRTRTTSQPSPGTSLSEALRASQSSVPSAHSRSPSPHRGGEKDGGAVDQGKSVVRTGGEGGEKIPHTPMDPTATRHDNPSPPGNHCAAGFHLSPWPYNSKPGVRLQYPKGKGAVLDFQSTAPSPVRAPVGRKSHGQPYALTQTERKAFRKWRQESAASSPPPSTPPNQQTQQQQGGSGKKASGKKRRKTSAANAADPSPRGGESGGQQA